MFADVSFLIAIDYILFVACVFLFIGSLYITWKTRFVQFSMLPNLVKLFFQTPNAQKQENSQTVLPHKALMTAMSTTLGVTTIAGPAIAISVGGPGALIGFLITSIFGSAATFTEVSLSIKYRKKSGFLIGGPMEYLKSLLSPKMAAWYAVSCCIVTTAWSSAQANQLAAIFNSPLLGDYRIDPIITGAIIAMLVLFTLFGGIKRISAISAKMVPAMFVLFLGSSFWILMANADKLPNVLATIFQSAFTPYAMASGALVGGVMSTMRWGILKGLQATEAGVGTQTIPHSLSETNDPIAQGTLSMVSTYTAGFVAFLSGCVVLVTDTWQNPDLPAGISMIAASFHMYFSNIGLAVVAICTFLFGFGTILGNSFNGSQCFIYLLDPKRIRYYFGLSAIVLFVGAITEVKTLWSIIDIFLIGMALPHMYALVRYVRRKDQKVENEDLRILENSTF